MYRFLLIAFAASVTATVVVNGPCPDVKRVKNFDFNSYAKGIWYEVGRYPNPAETNGDCGVAEYKLIDNNIAKVTNYDVSKQRLRYIEGVHKLAPDAGNTGKVETTLPYGVNGAYSNFTLNILAVDYDSYVVGYYCKYNETTRTREDFSWILSRCKNLSTNSKAAVEKTIRDNRFLDINNYIWPSFCDQACRAYA